MKKFLIIICFAFILNCGSTIIDRGDIDGTGIIIGKYPRMSENDFKYRYEVKAVFFNLGVFSDEDYNIGDRITFKPIKVEQKNEAKK